MAESVTVVVSGGVPVVDATPTSGTPADTRTTSGVPVTPVETGARPITIVASGAPPVVFISADGTSYLLGGVSTPGGSPYTMAAAVGSFVLTGQAATLTFAPAGVFTLTADAGTFTLTGDTMTPLVDYLVPADVAAFVLTGQDAALTSTATASRQFADLSIYRNAGSARSFASYDHYIAA